MRKQKETHPSRQASGCATLSPYRLSQEEWDEAWEDIGPWLVLAFTLAGIFVVLAEWGVI